MNAPFNCHQQLASLSLPAELESLSSPPLLLPGEAREKYELMRQAIFAELAPHSAIEWLLAIDVAELSWEIQRYRVLRHKLLEHYREKAIEQCLRYIDVPEASSDAKKSAHNHIRQNAQIWRADPRAASEIEARLAAYGYDAQTVNVQVYLEAHEIFLAFEALLNSAQNRRLSLLREFDNRQYGRNKPKNIQNRANETLEDLSVSSGPQPPVVDPKPRSPAGLRAHESCTPNLATP